jgi:gluconate kinase
MTEAAIDTLPDETATDGAEPRTTEQVGASSFSDLVRAHYKREQGRAARNGAALHQVEDEYHDKLARFEREEGKLASVYWSTRNASAVALTIGHEQHSRRNPFAETDMDVRLHRVTDWVTKNAEPIAELLHECDTLAIRAREILRGTSQRITLQLIYSVEEHALGFIERSDRRSAAREEEMVAAQRAELARIETYYLRTGAKAARIVYASGMLIGATLMVALCALVAVLLKHPFHYWNGHPDTHYLLLCTGAGAVGALVSVLSRMSSGDDDRFSIDFEVGRPLLRRLGLYKPFVGSVFGVATYFLLAGGLLPTTTASGNRLYFYGIIAFLAGFSERFTGVIFGKAEQLVGGASGQQQTQ